ELSSEVGGNVNTRMFDILGEVGEKSVKPNLIANSAKERAIFESTSADRAGRHLIDSGALIIFQQVEEQENMRDRQAWNFDPPSDEKGTGQLVKRLLCLCTLGQCNTDPVTNQDSREQRTTDSSNVRWNKCDCRQVLWVPCPLIVLVRSTGAVERSLTRGQCVFLDRQHIVMIAYSFICRTDTTSRAERVEEEGPENRAAFDCGLDDSSSDGAVKDLSGTISVSQDGPRLARPLHSSFALTRPSVWPREQRFKGSNTRSITGYQQQYRARSARVDDRRTVMASDQPAIEKEIQEFVFTRTGEKVRVDLGTEGQAAIVPVSHHGSTVLGIFWLRVLQHPNNYPPQHYPYRQLYRAAGKHLVSLRVDTVNIMVCLVTGTLTICGTVALDWFVMRFSGIMTAYTKPPAGGQELKEPFDAEQRRLMKTVRSQILKKYMADWPDVVVTEDMKVLDARQIMRDKQEEEGADDTDGKDPPVGPLLGEKPAAEYHIDNLLSSSALSSQLETLKQGVMTDGATLYAVWTSLLNRWFSDPQTKVFIVTPAIDEPSLERLCHIVLNHRLTASLEMLATPLESRCGHLADVRHNVMKKLTPKDRVFAEYKVYNSMVYPRAEFQAKFVAGLRGSSAEVLLTSADAKGKHFQEEHSSMVIFQELSAAEFDTRLLAPIIASID
ncbi:hypothetical protein BaRGS_00003761, partial [Batillaria attramentaria]